MASKLISTPGATRLVVVFHGFGANVRRFDGVCDAIQTNLPPADILLPDMWVGWVSNSDPVDVTLAVIDEIDRLMKVHDYQNIVLVGYSGGGLIARKLAIYINGEQKDAPFETKALGLCGGKAWAAKVDRIVLLAGMNQGWSFAPTSNVFVVWALQVLYYSLRAAGLAKLFGALRRGEPFVTDLRIQWLSLARVKKNSLTVVQLLGTIDDVVSPDDNIDLQSGRDFFYRDVGGSSHESITDFSDPTYGWPRRDAFVTGLVGAREDFGEDWRLSPGPEDAVDETVEHVLFVIHGIRDYGFWTAHVGRFVTAAAQRKNMRIMPLAPTYGYFAMLPFVLPGTRRAKIRWFMDQYVKALVRFPNAERFSYIGHSNGTYLLAGALTRYRCCHFWNVAFAGSVVRADFPWQDFIPDRARRVLNYVATADWVVALFPRFLARLGADVGGAGWDGFARLPLPTSSTVDGTHSAALRESNWDDIADFILTDALPAKPCPAPRHNGLVAALASVAPLIWAVLLGVILLPFVWFVPGKLGLPFSLVRPSVIMRRSLGARAFLAALWLWLMRAILTRL
jgi:pimeloyl-ACP methyl ester carboxylesterase